jgi:hypothetical protein
MSRHRVNPNRAKINRNYTARSLADRLGIHKNTVRDWRRKGLAPIDDERPYLFHGAAVRMFLIDWNKKRKRPCPPGMFYCFRCREPRKPVATSVEYLPMRLGTGNLRGACSECGTIMHRRVRQEAFQAVLPGVPVQNQGSSATPK